MRLSRLPTSIFSVAIFFATTTASADTLPYSVRTHAYNGWNSTVSGDVRTVGMAGATIGLPDTFLSATDNPSGLSMLLGDADDNVTGNSISDSHLQNQAYPLDTNSAGVAVNFYPWGVSFGYVTTSREGMPYELPSSGGLLSALDVSAREFKLGLSRMLLNQRLSLGASLNWGYAEEQISPGPDAHDTAIGATLGALMNFSKHWVGGLSFALPMNYAFADASAQNPTPELPGFYQPLVSPPRLGIGAGWIPNRFARVSLSVLAIGTNSGAALLADDRTAVGSSVTLQPRVGAAYCFVDYKEFTGTVFAGSYFETSRIDGASNRVHVTSGIEIHPWVFTVGAGADLSAGYSNYLTGLGIDIFKVLAKADIIPTPYRPASRGILPTPVHLQDEGLPRALVKHWKKRGPDMNPIKVIGDVPGRTQKKYYEVKKIFITPPNENDEDDQDGKNGD